MERENNDFIFLKNIKNKKWLYFVSTCVCTWVYMGMHVCASDPLEL